jgi:hypothetical protein
VSHSQEPPMPPAGLERWSCESESVAGTNSSSGGGGSRGTSSVGAVWAPQPSAAAAAAAAAGDRLTPRCMIKKAARLSTGALQAAQSVTPRTYLQVSDLCC